MDRFTDVVQDKNGRVISGASVLVLDENGLPADIFETREGTVKANPFLTDSLGKLTFCAADGLYSVQVTVNETLYATLPDIRLDDPEEGAGSGDFGTVVTDVFSGTGAQTIFTLAAAPKSKETTQVYVDGEYQEKSTYTMIGTALTFAVAPAAGTNNIEVVTITPGTGAASAITATAPAGQTGTNVQALINSLAGTFASNAAFLASEDGADSIGYDATKSVKEQLDIVTLDVNDLKDRALVSLAKFGGVPGASPATLFAAFIAAGVYLNARGGGILHVQPGTYNFGDASTSTFLCTLESWTDIMILAHGALFLLNTTANVEPVLFRFNNPNRVRFIGARFTDTGFTQTVWPANIRRGMFCVVITATTACSDFELSDFYAENVHGILVCDEQSDVTKYEFSNLRVQGTLKNAYYGPNILFSADNIDVKMNCVNVRRTFIAFAPRNFDIDIRVKCEANFLGSNAMISLAQDGTTDLQNGRIKLVVSGVEAHENLVHFYHQQANSAGAMRAVSADVQVTNLTTVGKNVLLGPMNVFRFDHEIPGGTIISSTMRTFDQIALSGSVYGTISGAIISVGSVPTVPGTLTVSPMLSDLFDLSTIASAFKIKSPYHGTFTPLIVGATTSGAATYTRSEGYYSVVDGICNFSVNLAWTAHTGTGSLEIAGLPLKLDTTKATLVACKVIPDGLTYTGGNVDGLIGGTAGQRVLLRQSTAGVLSSVPMDTAAGVWVAGTYPVQ